MKITTIRKFLAESRKALVALAALVVAAGSTDLSDDKWWVNLLIALAGAAGVWAVPNKEVE